MTWRICHDPVNNIFSFVYSVCKLMGRCLLALGVELSPSRYFFFVRGTHSLSSIVL